MIREAGTVQVMNRLYCHDHHRTKGDLCSDCCELLDYAGERLEKCPFQERKTTCAKCPVHCYRPEMREKIRRVMSYAGPRMTWRHPLLALWHILDGRRKVPAHQKSRLLKT